MGGSEVRQLRMIERHYFKDKLLKSFDFDFGFCMPYSRNSCEHIYEMPELTPQEGIEPLIIDTLSRENHFHNVTLFEVPSLLD